MKELTERQMTWIWRIFIAFQSVVIWFYLELILEMLIKIYSLK